MEKKKWILFLCIVGIIVLSSLTVFGIQTGLFKNEKEVHESIGYANITVTVPRDWKHEIVRGNGNDFSIDIWPKGYDDGRLRIMYCDMFGVCGTGLRVEETKIGKYEATKGIYDEQKSWSYIRLGGTAGDYAIDKAGVCSWWNEYEDEAMQILDTLIVGENAMTVTEAVKIAEKAIDTDYSSKWTRFDAQTGAWKITFFIEDDEADDVVVHVNAEGDITDVEPYK